jgi:putative ribosome biogenesis GTPase RsgA
MLASSSKDFRIIESGRQSWMWLKHLYPRRDKCLRDPSVRWLKLLVFVKSKLPNFSRKKILFKILKDLLHSLRELMILISKRNLRRLESRNLREKKRSSSQNLKSGRTVFNWSNVATLKELRKSSTMKIRLWGQQKILNREWLAWSQTLR